MKRSFAMPPLILLLLLTGAGCPNSATVGTPQADPIVRVADALDKISIAAAAGVDVTVLLRLPDRTNRPVLEVFRKLVLARQAAGRIVRDLNKLDTIDKTKLADLLKPAFAEFRRDSTLALVGISDQGARDKVAFYLGLVETALGTIEIALNWRQ